MGLSNDLISQFVKVTSDKSESKKETIAYGTVKVEDDGSKRVQLDGSDISTPISTTSGVRDGDRVMVLIKNHTATIIGNTSTPSARSDEIDEINEFRVLIVDDLNAEKAKVENLLADNVTIKEGLSANKADISKLKADNVEIAGKLEANEAEISNLQTTKLDAEIAEVTYAKTERLDATDAYIHNLESSYGEFAELTAENLKAVNAAVDNLDITYANIDFSNIGQAAMEYFYANSGLIGNVTVKDGVITGELQGVSISGDLMKANTIKADKLIVKGVDGLYYKLNVSAGATTSEGVTDDDLQNGLHGKSIIAKTITAEKISVSDLSAFGATIGGFTITGSSLYSGVKSSVGNTTTGIYLDSNGQFAIGDANNFIKYYKDTSNAYKLEISAASVLLGSGKKSVETAISEVDTKASNAQNSVDKAQTTANSAEEKASSAQTLIAQLSESISMLVTDGNGTSLMTQTEDGWTFSTAAIQTSVNGVSEALDSLTNEIGDVGSAVDILQQAVKDLGEIAEYVYITTYENEPCIELGEADSDFKLRITNTRMMFTEGSTVLAYFTNQAFNSKKVVIEEELQQGGFVWKVRSNGNMGLTWKGGNS